MPDTSHIEDLEKVSQLLSGTAPEIPSQVVKAIMDSITDGVIVADINGRIVLVNSRVSSIFGYSETRLLQMSVDDLTPHEVRAAHPGYRASFQDDPRPRPMGARSTNLAGRRKDGSLVALDIQLVPVVTDDVPYTVAILRRVALKVSADAEPSPPKTPPQHTPQ